MTGHRQTAASPCSLDHAPARRPAERRGDTDQTVTRTSGLRGPKSPHEESPAEEEGDLFLLPAAGRLTRLPVQIDHPKRSRRKQRRRASKKEKKTKFKN